MTCTTALVITAAAGLIYAAIGIYAVHRQQKWMAARQQRDHHE